MFSIEAIHDVHYKNKKGSNEKISFKEEKCYKKGKDIGKYGQLIGC
ncbi:unnamed protein product [marine sediment metagenome]|uniref:Uncharacterized protein n=1 Tax=marine sediment metagenome TaxID=412755 RepID=X1EGB1_9ZZZZ